MAALLVFVTCKSVEKLVDASALPEASPGSRRRMLRVGSPGRLVELTCTPCLGVHFLHLVGDEVTGGIGCETRTEAQIRASMKATRDGLEDPRFMSFFDAYGLDGLALTQIAQKKRQGQ